MESHESSSIKSLTDAFHLPFMGVWLMPYFVQHITDDTLVWNLIVIKKSGIEFMVVLSTVDCKQQIEYSSV
jgi:hypothetical protein